MHSMITKAFLFALYAHGEQKRKDGLPYIMHPVEVAMELARNGADEDLICAGFLHDTIEDAFITREQLSTAFTDKIADLVVADSEDKADTWEQRKTAALEALRAPGDFRMSAGAIFALPEMRFSHLWTFDFRISGIHLCT